MKRYMTISLLVACWMMGDLIASVALAESVDPPMKVLTYRANRTRIQGNLTAYDEQGFTLQQKGKETQTITWGELAAKDIYLIHYRLFSRTKIKPTDKTARTQLGKRYVELGQLLLSQKKGELMAERAFKAAIKQDPKLTDDIAQARKKGTELKNAKVIKEKPTKPAEHKHGQVKKVKFDPRYRWTNPDGTWIELDDEAQAKIIASQKAEGEEVQKKLNLKLRLFETDFFLLYTNLNAQEAKMWAGMMDKMYVKMCKMFALDKTKNIWYGKCPIYIFKKQIQYQRYQREFKNTDPGTSIGMCHNSSRGDVSVAMFRQPSKWDFAAVMVHETTHGFLHRFISPKRVDTWVNEGLADHVAQILVSQSSMTQRKEQAGQMMLQRNKSIGSNFWTSNRIEAWEYGVASDLTDFMIAQNPKGYIKFIKAIKAGKTPYKALEEDYGVTREQLIKGYGIVRRMPYLTP